MLTVASIYTVFQPLIDVFESVLKFFHSGGISWGWSIILLTISVRVLLIPLTLRQLKGMARMQSFAPQMKELQKKYKDDKQRQQQEMMKFYRENNINPAASCLPMILQLPAFFALYGMLRESLRTDICPAIQRAHNHNVLSIHHTVACGHTAASKFLFIPDLTSQATGVALVVLIVLYVGSQLSSSMLMATAAMDPTQRKLMMFMPILFVAFIFRFPAGLLVYWITTNLWTVGQSYIVRRRVGALKAAAPEGGVAVLTGGGSDEGSGGSTAGRRGFGARMWDRLEAAQEAGAAARADPGSKQSPERGAGAVRSTARSDGNSNGNGDGNGGGGRGRAKAPSGSASSVKAKGSAVTNGSTANGDGVRAGSPPPRPPRKKKKRSGRRR